MNVGDSATQRLAGILEAFAESRNSSEEVDGWGLVAGVFEAASKDRANVIGLHARLILLFREADGEMSELPFPSSTTRRPLGQALLGFSRMNLDDPVSQSLSWLTEDLLQAVRVGAAQVADHFKTTSIPPDELRRLRDQVHGLWNELHHEGVGLDEELLGFMRLHVDEMLWALDLYEVEGVAGLRGAALHGWGAVETTPSLWSRLAKSTVGRAFCKVVVGVAVVTASHAVDNLVGLSAGGAPIVIISQGLEPPKVPLQWRLPDDPQFDLPMSRAQGAEMKKSE